MIRDDRDGWDSVDGEGAAGPVVVGGGAGIDPLSFGDQSIAGNTVPRYMTPFYDNGAAQTNEIGIRVQVACILTRLVLVVRDGGGNGNAVNYTVRVSGMDTPMVISEPSTFTGTAVALGSVAVAQGETVSVSVTKAQAIGSSPKDVQIFIDAEAA